MPDEPTDTTADPADTGEQDRSEEGMAPLVTNTGDDTDESAPSG